MKISNLFNFIGFWTYNLIFTFLIVRCFVFNRGLGHGLGDLFYLIFFGFYFVIQLILSFLTIKNVFVKLLLFVISVSLSVFILFKIYLLYGPEVNYQWSHHLWRW